MSTPPQKQERRLRRRHGLDDVRGSVLFSYECRILNLSERGLAVQTTAALAPGRSYSLKVQHEGRQIPLAGTVAWCRLQGTERNEKGESVAVYTAGIELEGGLAGRAAEILPLLEERGVARLERRLEGHLRPRDAGDAAAEALVTSPITAREVSRTGMILVAPLQPAKGDLLDLRLELGDESLTVTARTTRVRSLGEREGREWSEIAVEYAEMSPADRARLDRLLREELGLPAAAPA